MADINCNGGEIHISNEVIATIAYTAMLEVEGTNDYSTLAKGIMEKIFKKSFKGVELSIEENNVKIDINLVVKLNYNIKEVAKNVQEKVKNSVETMTGLNVVSVNVKIIDININKENKKESNEK